MGLAPAPSPSCSKSNEVSAVFASYVTFACFFIILGDLIFRMFAYAQTMEEHGWFMYLPASVAAITSIWTLGPQNDITFHQIATIAASISFVSSIIGLIVEMKKAGAFIYYNKSNVDGKRVRFFGLKQIYKICIPLSGLVLCVIKLYNVGHANAVPPEVIEIMKAVVILLASHQIVTGYIDETQICARRREDGSLVKMRTISDFPSDKYLHVMEDLPHGWEDALCMINSQSEEQSKQAIKIVDYELSLVICNKSSRVDDIVRDGDRVVLYLTKLVKTSFHLEVSRTLDCCLYLFCPTPGQDILHALQQAFQIERLARVVQDTTLEQLVTTILLCIVDEKVPRKHELMQLKTALHTLMFAILNNAEPTSVFVILIRRLYPLDSFGILVERNLQLEDLVVMYLTDKALYNKIDEVDLRVVNSIHLYLEQLGKEEMDKRILDNDNSLNAIMTILREFVKLLGSELKQLVSTPINMGSPPIIFECIEHHLQSTEVECHLLSQYLKAM